MANVLVEQLTKKTFRTVVDHRFRHQISEVFRPRPWIYWSDFLVSASMGWSAFIMSTQAPLASVMYIGGTAIAICALLRALIFIHELTHLKRGKLPGFETAWNVLVGLPFMLPSLMYVGSHSDHHRQATFGTVADPEYAPIPQWKKLRIAGFIGTALIVPLLLAIRWGVLGPLSSVIPPLRCRVIERGSSLVINTDYRRPVPRGRSAVRWILQEPAAALVFWIVAVGIATNWIPVHWVLQWYLVAAGVVVVNQVRTLAAHRYVNDGTPLDTTGQLLDSITLGGRSLSVLAAPVGLRYHALHHALPTVPYHNLGSLHRRLLAELPVDSPYRHTQRSGILSTVAELFRQQSATASRPQINENCVGEGVSQSMDHRARMGASAAVRSVQCESLYVVPTSTARKATNS